MSRPPVRLLCVLPTLSLGGAERIMLTLLRHFDRARFAPALAVVNMRNAVYRDEVPADIEVIDLQCQRVRYALPRLVRLVRERRPEVVFSTLGYLNLALAAARPLFPANVRFVAREATILSENLWDLRFPELMVQGYRWFYPRLDGLICQSQAMRDDIIARARFPSGKASLIHNPVDVERVRAFAQEAPSLAMLGGTSRGGRPLELVAAGRLAIEKGFDTLIEAVAIARDVDLRLTILGEGDQRAPLTALAVRHGVDHRIRFAGYQRNPFAFFARADAFVLTSRYEAFPNVVLEALACDAPVIASPATGGLHEIARLAGGVQIAADMSASALADEIRAFAQRGSSAPPVSLARFRLQPIVRQYEQVLAGEASPVMVAA